MSCFWKLPKTGGICGTVQVMPLFSRVNRYLLLALSGREERRQHGSPNSEASKNIGSLSDCDGQGSDSDVGCLSPGSVAH